MTVPDKDLSDPQLGFSEDLGTLFISRLMSDTINYLKHQRTSLSL